MSTSSDPGRTEDLLAEIGRLGLDGSPAPCTYTLTEHQWHLLAESLRMMLDLPDLDTFVEDAEGAAYECEKAVRAARDANDRLRKATRAI